MTAATVAAIIPAAGTGSRLAADETSLGPPKALRRLGDDSVIRYAVRGLEDAVSYVVVATSAELIEAFGQELSGVPVPVVLVEGGPTRQQSVRRALAALDPSTTRVLVHDAARPLVPPEVTDRVLAALDAGAAAVVPAVPVDDTLRQVTTSRSSTTVDRSTMRAVQTPQGFTVEVLRRAHAGARGDEATDDAGLVEMLDVEVQIVEGDPHGFKITRAMDLTLARALVTAGTAQTKTSDVGHLPGLSGRHRP